MLWRKEFVGVFAKDFIYKMMSAGSELSYFYIFKLVVSKLKLGSFSYGV
jgi:hypothetical protein